MRAFSAVTALTVSVSMTLAPVVAPINAAMAAEGIGEAKAVIDAATASGSVGKRVLAVGSQVFLGDLVSTDGEGEAQLLFNDGTRMVVGANSELVIDEFLFRAASAENKFAVRALGGAFRFISGGSGDQGYSIRTPSATIGVRGTALDFNVTKTSTKMVLLEGAAEMCPDDDNEGGEVSGKSDECVVVATPCAVLGAGEDDKVEEMEPGKASDRAIREEFPYTTEDSKLQAPFQVSGHGCGTGGLAKSSIPSSQIPTGAIVVGGLVIVGGVVIGILAGGDSNNATND